MDTAIWDETFAQGERIGFELSLEDETGASLLLAGMTFSAQIRRQPLDVDPDADALAEWSFSAAVDDVVTVTLDENASNLTPGLYHQDLWMETDTDGPKRIAVGRVQVEPRYTPRSTP